MKKVLILAALVAIVAYRPRAADGVSAAPSLADQLGFGGLSDAVGGFGGLFLGGPPRGPFSAGFITPAKNYVYGNRTFVSPFDAKNASIGGWGGGIGNQYDPWIEGCYVKLPSGQWDSAPCHYNVN